MTRSIAALLFILTAASCHLTPAQQTALAGRAAAVAFDLAQCAVEGPALTALESYVGHRLDADPEAVRRDVSNALLSGVGRDIACALRSLAGRRSQAGEVTVVDPVKLVESRAGSCVDLKCEKTEARAAAVLLGLRKVGAVK